MSCFPEARYAIYVDGELPRDEVREVETHLVQCRECRALILALRDEGAAIADLLREKPLAVPQPVPARARARGLALGLLPTLGLALLVSTLMGWVLDQRLPSGMGWINPLNLFGVYEMFIDALFMLRDTAPVVFDLGIAVGATVGLAGVLTFLASALLRRIVGPALVLPFALLAVASAPSPAAAIDARWGQERVEIPASEKLDATLVVSADTIDIDGDVDGDLIAMGERISIRGAVAGNVFAVGREVVVAGKVDGSLHMACERCTLEGDVKRNVYAGGQNVTVRESGRIGRDAQLFGETVHMNGKIARDLFSGAGWLELRGEVGRDATTRTERLTIADDASIGRDLDMQTRDPEQTSIASGAQIGGETRESLFEHRMPGHQRAWTHAGFYLRALVFLVSAFLVGMLVHAIVPGLFSGHLSTAADFMRSLGFGFVALIATPIALVLCLVTVVGIPIGILGIFVYLTTLFISVIVVAALIGGSITGVEPESAHGFGLALLLGLVIVLVAMNLPFVGGLLRLLIGLTGMGLVVTTSLDLWRRPLRS